MASFLLTWNPTRWAWDDLADAALQTAEGTPHQMQWSCGNTRAIKRGDTVFLVKLGTQPKGIIAGGIVTSDEPVERPHWDDERAAQGDVGLFVEVEFERILDPTVYPLLKVDEFKKGPLSTVHWFSQSSGVRLPDEAATELATLWAEHVQTVSPPTQKPRNPPWQRDELLLALDVYFRFGPNRLGPNHEEIRTLSEVLNGLPIHKNRPDAEKFRNPNGVYMKLMNFRRFDPSYTGKGLQRGNKLEAVVWEEFVGQKELLSHIAAAIRAKYQSQEVVELDGGEEEEGFIEGKVVYRVHVTKERNKALVAAAKKRARERDGRLRCAVCTFDFGVFYGEVGEDFIECHHTQPLSELTKETKTRVEDIALLCSNCHRMVHRYRPWLRMDELHLIVKRQRT